MNLFLSQLDNCTAPMWIKLKKTGEYNSKWQQVLLKISYLSELTIDSTSMGPSNFESSSLVFASFSQGPAPEPEPPNPFHGPNGMDVLFSHHFLNVGISEIVGPLPDPDPSSLFSSSSSPKHLLLKQALFSSQSVIGS